MKHIAVILLSSLSMAFSVKDITHTSPNPGAAVAPVALTEGMVNTPYSYRMKELGGVGPYTWALDKGTTLPAGIKLDPSTGVISGTPVAAGASMAQTTVSDSSSPALVSHEAYSLTVAPASLAFATTMLSRIPVNERFSQQLVASGGTPPYTWSVAEGSLPDGVTLDSKTGILSGITHNGEKNTFTVQVTDSAAQSQKGWEVLMHWGQKEWQKV